MNPSGIFSSWPIHTLYFLNLVDQEFFEEAFLTKKEKVIGCFCDNYIDTNNKADGVNTFFVPNWFYKITFLKLISNSVASLR